MKKKVFLIILLILVGLAGFNFCSGQTSKDKLKEGDMIFHISQSQQSPLIQYATKSTLSHCGIIIEKLDSRLSVEVRHSSGLGGNHHDPGLDGRSSGLVQDSDSHLVLLCLIDGRIRRARLPQRTGKHTSRKSQEKRRKAFSQILLFLGHK